MYCSEGDSDREVSGGAASVTLREKVAFLNDPCAFGGLARRVQPRETHMSWVFFAGDFVFKLKKPVRFPYLDFSTVLKRHAACRAEVALNECLAPGVYLGVVPLCISKKGLALGEGGEAIDWLVKMRRLNQAHMLDSLVSGKGVNRRCIDAIARKLSDFYQTASPVFLRPEDYLRQWRINLEQNSAGLQNSRFGLPKARIRHCDFVLRQFVRRRQSLLLNRLRQRRIVDGHGDLRPEHIWLGEEVKIIDCIEFNARLRALDPLDEIAYLDLECEHLGAKGLGDYVRREVMRALRDEPPPFLYCFYRGYRAMLRARLSIGHLLSTEQRTPEKWRPQTLDYLEIAAADARCLEKALSRE